MSANGYAPSEDARRAGEVIEAGTSEFVAESYELHTCPAHGDLVRVGDPEAAIYGVVGSATTASLDPGRRPVARGRDLHREEEIFQNHPQIARLLRTEFRALTVGYRQAGAVRQQIPPFPAKIHGFVWACGPAEVERFTRDFGYLNLLLNAPAAGDELIAAVIRTAAAARGGSLAYRVAAGKWLAGRLIGQYQRLTVILDQIREESVSGRTDGP